MINTVIEREEQRTDLEWYQYDQEGNIFKSWQIKANDYNNALLEAHYTILPNIEIGEKSRIKVNITTWYYENNGITSGETKEAYLYFTEVQSYYIMNEEDKNFYTNEIRNAWREEPFSSIKYNKTQNLYELYLSSYAYVNDENARGQIDTNAAIKSFGSLTGIKFKGRKGIVTKDYIYMTLYAPEDYKPPEIIQGGIEGNETITFLYNTGQQLSGTGSWLSTILNYKIGDYNLLSLMIGGGFIVYMGWVVLKWIIPI